MAALHDERFILAFVSTQFECRLDILKSMHLVEINRSIIGNIISISPFFIFRVNKVVGNRLFPFRMPENLRPGMALYRNNDQAFEQILARKTAERRIPLFIELQPVLEKDEDNGEVVDGFLVTANIFKSVEQGLYYKAAEVFTPMQLQCAKRSQHDNMIAQMSKFGESKYECKHVVLKNDIDAAFIPNSVLSNVRRELIQKLDQRITDELNRSLSATLF